MFAWFRGRRGATAEELTSHVTFESAEAISVVLEDHAPGARGPTPPVVSF